MNLTSEEYDIVEQKFNDFDPRMMRLLHPKAYDIPMGFGSPRAVALDLCIALMCMRYTSPMYAGQEALKDVAILNGALNAEALIQQNVPTFFIAKQFLAATNNSNPPLDFPLKELRFPFPAMIFMLPRGALDSPKDGPIEYLAFSLWKNCPTNIISSFSDGRKFYIVSDRISWFTRARGNTVQGTFGADVGNLEKGTLGEFFTTIDSDSDYKDPSFFSLPIDKADGLFMRKVPRIIIKILLAIAAQPELIELGFERKRTRIENGNVCPPRWTPNMIGRNYQS